MLINKKEANQQQRSCRLSAAAGRSTLRGLTLLAAMLHDQQGIWVQNAPAQQVVVTSHQFKCANRTNEQRR